MLLAHTYSIFHNRLLRRGLSSLLYDYSSFIVPLTLPCYKSPLRELCRIRLTHPDIAYLSVCVLPQERLHILAAYTIQRYRLSLYNLFAFCIKPIFIFFLNILINRNEIEYRRRAAPDVSLSFG